MSKLTTQNRALVAREGVGEPPAMLLGEVEIVHRPGDIEVGVGVEPVDEADPLVAQIAFDLEIGVEAEALGPLAVAACSRRPNFSVRPASDR